MNTATELVPDDRRLEHFEEYTRCPQEVLECLDGYREDGRSAAPPRRNLQQVAAWVDELVAKDPHPQVVDRAIEALRLETYIDNSVEQARQGLIKRAVRSAYYHLRPAFPVAFRKHLQQIALKDWSSKPFPSWPVDVSVEKLVAKQWAHLLRKHNVSELPFIWFWPDGKSAACIMTHDVETGVGRDFCSSLMAMEARFGVVSAFEVVPEVRYSVPSDFLQSIREGGCEVCLHGLNHDGRLFSSREIFLSRRDRIRQYAQDWGAVGFRSPVMYRNLEWLPELGFSYDMSVPNVGHLDPQPGGCCTVMPYFIGSLLELPLTAVQDYSLFNILGERSTRIWETQIERVMKANGLLSFIIHPDYVNEDWSSSLYLALLEILARLRDDSNLWFALPRDVDMWWRMRQALRLVKVGSQWQIVGEGANRARIAYARIDSGTVHYRLS